HANPRARGWFIDHEARVLGAARAMGYRLFDLQMTDWERLADQDGTADRSQRRHDNRDATLAQDYDGGWTVRAGCGSVQGAQLHDILRAFLAAEEAADWTTARAEHGPDASADQLPRTDNQRRFDAFFKVFEVAASARAGEPGGSVVVTNVVIDHATFERELRRIFGPGTHSRPGTEPVTDDDIDRFRCSTLDGHPIDPTEAVVAALHGHIRRVVIDSDSVVTDLGRRVRCFTGPAALAVRLSTTECVWPGCGVPTTRCQIDHLTPWAPPHHGRTDPGNGAPLCGRHNRFKHDHGYRAWRDPAGAWHTSRPDGTELT
ncbi:MAG: HNH endonuclease, partial [Actinobacteria bacterium]|nr:HNH endonuclease [Actinomycetota bacterium]